MDKGKHYLLNNETGEMKKVLKTGDFIKEFDASLTGAVGFVERTRRAQNNPGYMPHQASSLKFNPNNAFYTPQNNKFESYMQMPHPRTQPYFNKEKEFQLNRRKNLIQL
ncbi:hypothetical protein PPERSA_12251 [Pseudocohnilembus persalinus]|uniref:Uncharacterized protein n=1 Tax=Pseudocohnilembus persalinus TaxID=266149 RepID=A0A0V0R4U1_PSEPJ|nr:hypothetical protein PPERSA_12251 [Pseudocohnilembus persalinus]|eukprot:KRX09508.1 hypothetical protein PPERSA_12251 [Pseudocohnilembus persalinus]